MAQSLVVCNCRLHCVVPSAHHWGPPSVYKHSLALCIMHSSSSSSSSGRSSRSSPTATAAAAAPSVTHQVYCTELIRRLTSSAVLETQQQQQSVLCGMLNCVSTPPSYVSGCIPPGPCPEPCRTPQQPLLDSLCNAGNSGPSGYSSALEEHRRTAAVNSLKVQLSLCILQPRQTTLPYMHTA